MIHFMFYVFYVFVVVVVVEMLRFDFVYPVAGNL